MTPRVENTPAGLRIDWPAGNTTKFYEVVPSSASLPEAIVVNGQIVDLRTTFVAREVEQSRPADT